MSAGFVDLIGREDGAVQKSFAKSLESMAR
jgi:hypothetical protein